MTFTSAQIVDIDDTFKKHIQYYDKVFNGNEKYGNRRTPAQSYTFKSKNQPSVFYKVISLNPGEQFNVTNNEGLNQRGITFNSFKISFNIWLAKYTPEPKLKFTEVQLAKIKVSIEPYQDYCNVQGNQHRVRITSYHSMGKGYFFQLEPTEDDNFNREVVDLTGSHLIIKRGFDNSISALKVWLEGIKKKIESDSEFRREYLENKKIFDDFGTSQSIEDYEMSDLQENKSKMDDEEDKDQNTMLNYKQLVLSTIEHLKKEGKHIDCRIFWNQNGVHSEDEQLKIRTNLASDGIIHELDTDVWKIRLTADIGQKITPNQLDQYGRYIQSIRSEKHPEKPISRPLGEKFSNNFLIAVVGFLIGIVIPGLIWHSVYRYDRGYDNGYLHGKDSFSNERSKLESEIVRLKKLGDKAEPNSQIIDSINNVINEKDVKIRQLSSELNNYRTQKYELRIPLNQDFHDRNSSKLFRASVGRDVGYRIYMYDLGRKEIDSWNSSEFAKRTVGNFGIITFVTATTTNITLEVYKFSATQ